MDEEQIPYNAEYAKSSRASCKGCKSLISKETLRIAHMIKSSFYDGMMAHWYHYSCFFHKFRPASTDDIRNFLNLRLADQEKIQTQVDKHSKATSSAGSSSGRAAALKDFVVQYALSNRSKCRDCEKKIEKDEIRISHKEVNSEKPHLGLVDRWFHVGCFKKNRSDLGWEEHFTPSMMTGFRAIDPSDRNTLTEVLKPKKSKKKKGPLTDIKTNANEDVKPDLQKEKESAKFRKQHEDLWVIIDSLKKENFTKPQLADILHHNDQISPVGFNKLYDRLADAMMFGCLPHCPVCKNGQFVVSSTSMYRCIGNISEWTTCTNTTMEVKRSPFNVPPELEDRPCFETYKYKSRTRVFPPKAPFIPLKNLSVVLHGKFTRSKKDLKADVEALGGAVTNAIHKAYFVITTKKAVEAQSKMIDSAREQNIFVVGDDILDELKSITEKSMLRPALVKCNIGNWGEEHKERGVSGMAAKRKYGKSGLETDEKRVRLTVKNGSAVDPESGLEGLVHVHSANGKKYTATLAMVNAVNDTNSFYKLQLLKHDNAKIYHVFRSWGRVGTKIGGEKLERFGSEKSAMQNFEELYLEKSGNDFYTQNFEKMPHKFFPMDIDYGEEESKVAHLEDAGKNSKLDIRLQKLIQMIFDIETMKRAMAEFELDLHKMPLGKLSKQQMQKAYSVLTEANEILSTPITPQRGTLLLDCSNRFYTLLPHSFGMKQPPLLDNEKIIQSKVEMLDSLMDIEIAYNILTHESKSADHEMDPLDANYEKLKCKLEPLEHSSEEFDMIKKYVSNTHAATHSSYKLVVEDVFKVERLGEERRFRSFKKLHNRQLLWHGSRVTNYAGILSQGLRIAPPEAPVTGYMFGKGLYFADMVSKSANYCYTAPQNPIGITLLSEVALGNMKEVKHAHNFKKLPSGHHSVKGLGETSPSPDQAITLKDGTIVPLGNPCSNQMDDSSLLYNEYIVYDVAQVKIKYLLKMKFEYDSLW